MRKFIIILILVLTAIGVGGMIYLSRPTFLTKLTVSTNKSTSTTTTTATTSDQLPLYTGDPIENIGNDPFIKMVPAAYLEKYKKELAELNDALINNKSDVDKWLRVGVIKKFFNNYLGARDAWEYAKLINPNHSTVYYNLGGLYSHYLRDYSKAEENYLKAIMIDPNLSYLYLGLADFYHTFVGNTAKALETVKQGLLALPNDASLLKARDYYSSKLSP